VQALVTGGAGFIGSHLVDALRGHGHEVRVLDDLSNGFRRNVPDGVEFHLGDVSDAEVVRRAMEGVDVVFHQAALGSISRSLKDPLRTNLVNVQGTLAVLECARQAGTRRVVIASSSSVYGGLAPLPASERYSPVPRSPYAVSKLTGEHYARVFTELLGVETVCLRYFNVYGPRQRADSPYAAVIPLFVDALRSGRSAEIHGDGLQSRDFTFVSDVVQANLLAASAPGERCGGRVYNIAGGRQHSVLDLLRTLGTLLGVQPTAEYAPPRPGDVRDSHADLSAASADLGYAPTVTLADGLRRLLEATG
jgi:nucleoside-diphosphate-sugar epimerase